MGASITKLTYKRHVVILLTTALPFGLTGEHRI